jgi:hypothetical protein
MIVWLFSRIYLTPILQLLLFIWHTGSTCWSSFIFFISPHSSILSLSQIILLSLIGILDSNRKRQHYPCYLIFSQAEFSSRLTPFPISILAKSKRDTASRRLAGGQAWSGGDGATRRGRPATLPPRRWLLSALVPASDCSPSPSTPPPLALTTGPTPSPSARVAQPWSNSMRTGMASQICGEAYLLRQPQPAAKLQCAARRSSSDGPPTAARWGAPSAASSVGHPELVLLRRLPLLHFSLGG